MALEVTSERMREMEALRLNQDLLHKHIEDVKQKQESER